MKDFKQVLTENSYFRQEEFVFADCDRHQRARVSALLSRAAAYAGHDYDARGLTHDKLLAMREVFLLSRMAMRIHRCPTAQKVAEITTWENGAKGAHMQRVYEIAGEDGQLCVSMKSDWILVDPETRKIMRPDAFTARQLSVCPKAIDCPDTRKIQMPREGLEEWDLRTVRWSDLDGNGHLYSGRYGDIVWDALPPDLQERTPQEFFINYSREATLGQELRLLGVRTAEGCKVEGTGPLGVCFTCECVF